MADYVLLAGEKDSQLSHNKDGDGSSKSYNGSSNHGSENNTHDDCMSLEQSNQFLYPIINVS